MQTLRRLALGALWALAAVGIACGMVWAATTAGIIKPLVVISGSMEPGIMTGDLLVATKVPAASVHVGDVVSLHGELTGDLVTHRVEKIQPDGEGAPPIVISTHTFDSSSRLVSFLHPLAHRLDACCWFRALPLRHGL